MPLPDLKVHYVDLKLRKLLFTTVMMRWNQLVNSYFIYLHINKPTRRRLKSPKHCLKLVRELLRRALQMQTRSKPGLNCSFSLFSHQKSIGGDFFFSLKISLQKTSQCTFKPLLVEIPHRFYSSIEMNFSYLFASISKLSIAITKH